MSILAPKLKAVSYRVGLCAALLSVSAPLYAQDGEITVSRPDQDAQENQEALKKPQEEIYSGVIPGTRNTVGHIEGSLNQGKSSAQSMLTWVGFVPEENRTRVFIQMGGEHNYTMERGKDGRSISLIYTNTKIGARNVTRAVDASGYKRAVKLIEVKKKGRDKVIVKLTVDPSTEPQISQQGPFLYLDFPYSKK